MERAAAEAGARAGRSCALAFSSRKSVTEQITRWADDAWHGDGVATLEESHGDLGQAIHATRVSRAYQRAFIESCLARPQVQRRLKAEAPAGKR